MTEVRELATGLKFPEGPVALPDGSVLLVEIARGTLSRVAPDGTVDVVADCGGGPNGAALGPEGKVYIANNGGFFDWHDLDGLTVPAHGSTGHVGGSIQRVDLDTGEVETLYTQCDGVGLVAPNDLVFDGHGGIWFTDHGVRPDHHPDRPGVLYAAADGSSISPVVYGTDSTNGIGLSPDGDRLYVAETTSGRVWAWDVTAPGRVGTDPASPAAHGGTLLYDAPEGDLFDSLAVDGEGWVCVATIVRGGITSIRPDGGEAHHLALDDPIVTNICFGGPDLRTAFITASAFGRLLAVDWPRVGLRLNG